MSDWPATEIHLIPVEELKEADANSRLHSAEQIAQIAKSIQEFGWTIPVLIDTDCTLIAGHARVRAAKTLGIQEVPCMIADGWSASKKEAYQIADNRLAENASWDDDVLAAQVKRLASVDFNLDALGLDLTKFDLGDAFAPNVAPTAGTKEVDGGALQKAGEKLEGAIKGGGAGQKYTVICPDCGNEFQIEV